MKKYDFGGWATKSGILCADGRVIGNQAFKDDDGKKVPLVWNHRHDGPENVCGYAILQHSDEGVYAFCKTNATERGKLAKELVEHGDITSLSIYANHLTQKGREVEHGMIREVSLVLAGANPEARIDTLFVEHSTDGGEEALIYHGEDEFDLFEDDMEEPGEEDEKDEEKDTDMADDVKHADEKEKTVQDVIDTMNEEQQAVLFGLLAAMDEENDDDSEGEDDDMKHNAFDDSYEQSDVLTHDDMVEIFADAKKMGSLKDAVLEHGITDIELLFPDAKNVTKEPIFVKRDDTWVSYFMNNVHRSPMSRIRSLFANITGAEARAKGYTKTKKKIDEVFALLKRETTPQTIYKKQKLERDDVVDITDFDVVSWLKREMRTMLDEEIARAALVGDGRPDASDDKISPLHIRPIYTDDDFYSIKVPVEVTGDYTPDKRAKAFIRNTIKARKNYKGSGNPVLFTTEDMLTDLLLLEDTTGRLIYTSVDALATTLRVSKIITVPVMENLTRTKSGFNYELLGIVVNLKDYNVGADKGGAVNMFDDFDIDYNAMKYLMETRCSGALTVPYSAMVIEYKTAVTTTPDPDPDPDDTENTEPEG